MKPLSPFIGDFAYKTVTESLGLGSLDAGERVKRLLTTPAEILLASSGPGIPLMPILDGSLIKNNLTHAQWRDGSGQGKLPGLTWCESLLIGDCGFDVRQALTRTTPEINVPLAYRQNAGLYLLLHALPEESRHRGCIPQ